MAISTNQKPTIYLNLYENTAPGGSRRLFSGSMQERRNTTRWPNVGLTFAQQLRRRPNINPALDERVVFTGIAIGHCHSVIISMIYTVADQLVPTNTGVQLKLIWCWANIVDDGPASKQQWISAPVCWGGLEICLVQGSSRRQNGGPCEIYDPIGFCFQSRGLQIRWRHHTTGDIDLKVMQSRQARDFDPLLG